MIVDVDVRKDHELVTIEGVFLGATTVKNTFQDVTRVEGVINLMIPDSPSEKRTIDIKFKDVSLLTHINDTYTFGDKFKARCLSNAYQNKITHRLYEILEV